MQLRDPAAAVAVPGVRPARPADEQVVAEVPAGECVTPEYTENASPFLTPVLCRPTSPTLPRCSLNACSTTLYITLRMKYVGPPSDGCELIPMNTLVIRLRITRTLPR